MQHTLLLIKPNATKKHVSGAILKMIEEAGFVIEGMKMLRMDRQFADTFYAVHRGKSFYDRLIEFMVSGKTVAVALSREDAVKYLREFIGATNPDEAAEGTIRKLYGDTVTYNAVHASDSPENAEKELAFVFPELNLNQ